MTIDQVQHGYFYEYKQSKGKIVPVFVVDVIPGPDGGVIATNMDTKKELYIKGKQIKHLGPVIESLNQWRLKNGD